MTDGIHPASQLLLIAGLVVSTAVASSRDGLRALVVFTAVFAVAFLIDAAARRARVSPEKATNRRNV